ncbi:MAG: GNAT family N-acetyltransferase, partial [Saprospiraceae bacterium]|nr:GNAT family N-acetyltransferase [Saprospiraceae bacterium]
LISLLAKYRNDESMQALLALDDQGRTVAGALFVADERYVYYLLGFRDESLSNNQGNTLLLWHGIEWALKTNRYFDFEGSSIPGVAHYFRRFGGEQRLCLEVYRP